MKKLLAASIALVFLGALIFVSSYTDAQNPQRPSRPQRQSSNRNPASLINRSMALEASWAQISFALEVTDEQLLKARKAYQIAWNDSRKLIKKVTNNEIKRQDIRTKVAKIQKGLNDKIKTILTDKQHAKFMDWIKKTSRQRRSTGGRQDTRQRRDTQESPAR